MKESAASFPPSPAAYLRFSDLGKHVMQVPVVQIKVPPIDIRQVDQLLHGYVIEVFFQQQSCQAVLTGFAWFCVHAGPEAY